MLNYILIINILGLISFNYSQKSIKCHENSKELRSDFDLSLQKREYKDFWNSDSAFNSSNILEQDSYLFKYFTNKNIDYNDEIFMKKNDSTLVLIGFNRIIELNEDFSIKSQILIDRKKLDKFTSLNQVIIDDDSYLYIFLKSETAGFQWSSKKTVIFEKIDSNGKILWTEKKETLEFVSIINSNNNEFFGIHNKEKITVYSKSGKKVSDHLLTGDFFELKITDSGIPVALQIEENELFLVDISKQGFRKKLDAPFGLNMSDFKLDISPLQDIFVISALIAKPSKERSNFSKKIVYDNFKTIGVNVKTIRVSDFNEIQNLTSFFENEINSNGPLFTEHTTSEGIELLVNRGVKFRNSDIVLQVEKSYTIFSTSGTMFFNTSLILIKFDGQESDIVVVDKNSTVRYEEALSSFFSFSDGESLILCYNESIATPKNSEFVLKIFDKDLKNIKTQTFDIHKSIPIVNQFRDKLVYKNNEFYFRTINIKNFKEFSILKVGKN